HHVAVRHPETHLLPSTTTRDNAACSAATQLSLAVTMLESVPLLDGTKMAGVCWLVADQHLAALTALPHKPAEGLYMGGCPIDGPAPDTPLSAPKFTAHYGGEFLAMDALLWLRAYELTEDPAHWRVAVGLARFYAEAGRVPESAVARAHVYGSLIDLMVAMYEHEGGEQWMPAAESYAQQAIEALYADGLFRGATGLWYYESETWPSTLAYSLLRLHAVKSGIEMERSYFHR
ncbi:MAG TPA: hypothetical protein QGH10_12735, partial [Armatimonadota bacterium]|nr:hypothetical protein [Armatimonadota bacterium]